MRFNFISFIFILFSSNAFSQVSSLTIDCPAQLSHINSQNITVCWTINGNGSDWNYDLYLLVFNSTSYTSISSYVKKLKIASEITSATNGQCFTNDISIPALEKTYTLKLGLQKPGTSKPDIYDILSANKYIYYGLACDGYVNLENFVVPNSAEIPAGQSSVSVDISSSFSVTGAFECGCTIDKSEIYIDDSRVSNVSGDRDNNLTHSFSTAKNYSLQLKVYHHNCPAETSSPSVYSRSINITKGTLLCTGEPTINSFTILEKTITWNITNSDPEGCGCDISNIELSRTNQTTGHGIVLYNTTNKTSSFIDNDVLVGNYRYWIFVSLNSSCKSNSTKSIYVDKVFEKDWSETIKINDISVEDGQQDLSDPDYTSGVFVCAEIENMSGSQLKEIEIGLNIESIGDVPIKLQSVYDSDKNNKIDALNNKFKYRIARIETLPSNIFENKKVTVGIKSIDGESVVGVNLSKHFSIYYPVNSTNQSFNMKIDSYSFSNWTPSLDEFRPWYRKHIFQNGMGEEFIYYSSFDAALCYGMALSSADYSNDPTKIPIVNLRTRDLTQSDELVLNKLFMYDAAQTFPNALDGLGYWGPSTATEVFDRIKSNFSENIMSLIGLCRDGIIIPKHADVAFKAIVDVDSYVGRISIYENQDPRGIRYLEFDLKHNTYENYLTGGRTYQVIKAIKAKTYSMEDAVLGIKMKLENLYSGLLKSNEIAIISSCPVRILATNLIGDRYGFINGTTFVSEISGIHFDEINTDTIGINKIQIFYLPFNFIGEISFLAIAKGLMKVSIYKPIRETIIDYIHFDDIPIFEKSCNLLPITGLNNYLMECDSNGDGSVDTVVNGTKESFDLTTSIKIPTHNINNFHINLTPNPFNPIVSIEYYLPKQDNISIGIYSIKGELLCSIDNGYKFKGNHKVYWNGTDSHGLFLNSGCYFVKFNSAIGLKSTSKLLLIR